MTRPAESPAMRVFRRLGLDSVAWSLRRLHCPVPADALVLDVGSGGNPYPRANVLLDAFEDTIERYHAPLVSDRPLVYGLAERMPFRDKAFDFVIASHVLEHTAHPEAFLGELARVGRAGYIETPDAFFERINPFRFHRLEVTDVDGKLLIHKKPSWRPHGEWVDLYERKVKDRQFIRFLGAHPAPFYVRFYWQDSIPFEVLNPEVDASWSFPSEASGKQAPAGWSRRLRANTVAAARRLLSQHARNRHLELLDLLRCPTCSHPELRAQDARLTCPGCGAAYELSNSVPILYPKDPVGRK